MVEYSSALHNVCFSFLDRAEVLALLAVMEEVSAKAGHILYKTDDPADCLYVLVAGKVAVQKFTGFGDRMQVVALLESGAPVGESGLLDSRRRGSIIAVIADAQLLSLSRQAFAVLSVGNPSLAVKVLKWLMGRITLRLNKSSERLAHVL
jgi:CRP/FNR family transcriptional regulator, cyclic AMP receptor protein